MKWLKLAYDFGETVYKGIKLAKALGGGDSSRSIDPMYHDTSKPFLGVRGTRKLVKSDAPKDAFLDTTGDEGLIGVVNAPNTKFSRDLSRTLSRLEGFTTKLD